MPNSLNHLLVNGRLPDQSFADDEFLYVRFKANEMEGEGIHPSKVIKFPKWSTNRAKYSEPKDVLLPNFLDYGIAQFRVIDIPKPLSSDEGVTYQFSPVHDPTPENYAHTEVRTFKKDGALDVNEEPPKSIRKVFRTQLADFIKIFVTVQSPSHL